MSVLILNAVLALVRRHGMRIAALAAGFLSGRRSARAGQTRRVLKNAERAAESDRRVRDAVRRGDGDGLRDKWSRRD